MAAQLLGRPSMPKTPGYATFSMVRACMREAYGLVCLCVSMCMPCSASS